MRTEAEQHIYDIATRLFFERGIHQVSIRDISEHAKVNVSMVNYYFRSKDTLIGLIIDEKITVYHTTLMVILSSQTPLDKKITHFVSTFIDLLVEDPGFVLFLFSILQSKPELIMNSRVPEVFFEIQFLEKQMNEEQSRGKIIQCNTEQFYIAMLSLIVFPIAISPFLASRKKISAHGVTKYIRAQKEMISKMLISYLTPIPQVQKLNNRD